MTLAAPPDELEIPRWLHERLVATVAARFPRKTFGYFVAGCGARVPTDFVVFEDNTRNEPEWRPEFEARGAYFVEHDDAGFVASPAEAWRIQKELWARGLERVGVFHSHQRHPANFSDIDWDLHLRGMGEGWHVIVSMRNPELPQARAFWVSADGVRELPWAEGTAAPASALETGSGEDGSFLSRAREILALDAHGLPRCRDACLLFRTIAGLLRTRDTGAIEELLVNGFLRDSEARYHEHVAPAMCRVERRRFTMGARGARRPALFCEHPSHEVEVRSFELCRYLVTNELYALLDPRWREVPRGDRRKPAVGVSWLEAKLFALWMGCRLPTEAEWEFACGAGAEWEWCCPEESSLVRYAWYSENSGGQVQEAGTREPNQLGLYDLHGNVWEWCEDDYGADFYRCSPVVDPVNRGGRHSRSPRDSDRVIRGGSCNALAEMCRTRYRLHEPPRFWSMDLGFRLARHGGELSQKEVGFE